MNLNLFENLKKDIESNVTIKSFMEELSDFLKDMSSVIIENKNNSINYENVSDTKDNLLDTQNTLDEKLKKYRKEGHLYFVTEDRNNEIYLWDFTDKPKYEFKEIVTSEDLLSVAKEGAMLQYKNGTYELYSPYGYDMLYNEEDNANDTFKEK